ncbi:DNA-binding helix-turn-helix protein [Peptoniphilus duerdenii ATCC BAA-1640]|uniref:DNA-binding helix-turn-helix protein n=1 Tax=Peptoniphilus duerdenii ATCC BAA-1640 TaxID=862517 RepID=E0NND5_9FIRM|nr:helix-turn-helix transcriptional regulator [Peptoniphilus duerdenii]EFM24808.1 DNA-binding helix-turn-helix protein [Peptoniphilus duerdenii ATCC BAA-1640]
MKKSLAEIREENSKTQKDMADLLGIAVSTYCQYETGKRNLPVETVNKISKILNVNKNDIFLPIKFTVGKL